MKNILVFFCVLLFVSCDKKHSIEGIYYVNNNRADKVYIEKIKKNTFHIYTPGTWDEIATLQKNELKGTWSYPEDYHVEKDAGLSGKHIAKINQKGNNIEVQLLSPDNRSWGKATWTKQEKQKTRQKEISKLKNKTIYLTFDDGPLEGTLNVLKVIEKKRVNATFFLVGEHANKISTKNREMLEELKNNKRTLLANHSYSHAHNNYSIFYESPNQVLTDIQKNQQEILQFENNWKRIRKKNISPNIVRLPGRNAWKVGGYEFYDLQDARNSMELLAQNNMEIFGWDVEWKTKNGKPHESVDVMVSKIIFRLENHKTKFTNRCVVLMHDPMFSAENDAQKLAELIQRLKKKGCKFKMLNNFE